MVYTLLFIFIIFASAIETKIPLMNYWDEVALAVCVIYILSNIINKKKMSKTIVKIFLILFLLILIGIFGDIISPKFQLNKIAIIKDIIAFIKFPTTMIGFILMINQRKLENSFRKIVTISKTIVYFTFLCMIVGLFWNLGFYIDDEFRYFKTFRFVFSHPTFLVFSFLIIVSVLMMDSINKNKYAILACCIILFMTQRTKAYFAIAIVCFLMFVKKEFIIMFFSNISKHTHIKKRYFFIVLPVLILTIWLFAKDKYYYYFQYGIYAARPALYITGIKLAMMRFPIGSGLGTFASSISGEYYSKVYEIYGISDVIGLTRDKYSYMADVYWPYIYGQFGIMGCILYVTLLVKIFRYQLSLIHRYENIVVFVVVWMYSLFASTAEAFFTNSTAVQMAFLLTFCLLAKQSSIHYYNK